MKIFYNYIYLDPRKTGRYEYSDCDMCFLFEPFYVGKGKDNRWRCHTRKGSLKYNSYKNNKIKKILSEGYEMLEYIIIFNKLAFEDDAKTREKKLIKSIGRLDMSLGPLTNLTDGGDGTSGVIKEGSKGEKNGNYGRVYTDEEKLNLSLKNKGRKFTDEQKANVSASLIGKKKSEEHKKNLSIASYKKERLKCPYCEVTGDPGSMKRWHFENCRNKKGKK